MTVIDRHVPACKHTQKEIEIVVATITSQASSVSLGVY